MKRNLLKSVFLFTGMVFLFPVNQAVAASDDECAIWLCLPAGFGEGCGAAHKAFKNRLKKRKSPLPSWGSCAVGDDTSEPYSYTTRFKTYTNYGRGKVSTSYGQSCPDNGIIYWDNNRYSGIQAICTTTEIYTTTFHDGSGTYVHEEERWGKPLEQTMSKTFKPGRRESDRGTGTNR